MASFRLPARLPYHLMAVLLALAWLATRPASLRAEPTAPSGTPSQPKENSADRLMFWINADQLLVLSDAQLDQWKHRGVGGFVCANRQLFGLGGTHDWTGDPKSDLRDPKYALQRRFRETEIVRRARERGMKTYLGCYLVNYYNPATPLKDWFDDAGWANEVIPRVRDLAVAARQLGAAGIVFDQELYPQLKGATATWAWNYPGNTHSEAEVRNKAKQRGRELMKGILEGFPQAELLVYDAHFPETWDEVVQKEVNKIEHANAPLLHLDFWDGLSSVEGYAAIRLMNATFYKMPHRGTWDTALQYQYNSLYSLLSRRWSNWSYASSRVYESPSAWIEVGTPGELPFAEARPPDYVTAQLAAFKKWSMGREFVVYAGHLGLTGFDYTPYLGALQDANTPSVMDAEPPVLQITTPSRTTTGKTLALAGSTTDNLAIRAIRWRNTRGGEGAARMTWHIKSGDYRSGYQWQMDWSIPEIPLQPGRNLITITAEDIKGLTATKSLMMNAP